MRAKSVVSVLLIFGISVAITSAALSMGSVPSGRSIAGAEGGQGQATIIDLGIPVDFVDANGDGAVESLKVTGTSDIIYTFSSPIPMPNSGDVIYLEGELKIAGASLPIPVGTQVVAN